MSSSSRRYISKEIIQRELESQPKSPPSAGHDLEGVMEYEQKFISTYRSFIRFNIIKLKRNQVIDDNLFSALRKLLAENPSLSYESFKLIASLTPDKAKKYFTAKMFLLFPRDVNGCIDSDLFVRFIERSVEIESTMLNLMEYAATDVDDPSTTTITVQQLESFICRLIPVIDINQQMHESFHEFFAYTASQKFLFFLDVHRRNTLPIKTLAHSAIMEELLTLCLISRNINSGISSYSVDTKQISSNWFSSSNALRIYSTFLDLDKDQNGMLGIDEIKLFTGFSRNQEQLQFTDTAWKHLFDEYVVYQPCELDYKGFVNIVLATENMTSPQAIRYFWRVIDYDKSGKLTPRKIKHFYADVRRSLLSLNYDAPDPDHVVLEIYDLLSCNTASGAKLDDLIRSKQGHTVITMLLDVNGFWRYDNRENLIASGPPENEPEEENNYGGGSSANTPIAGAHNKSYTIGTNHNEGGDDTDEHGVIARASEGLYEQQKQKQQQQQQQKQRQDDDEEEEVSTVPATEFNNVYNQTDMSWNSGNSGDSSPLSSSPLSSPKQLGGKHFTYSAARSPLDDEPHPKHSIPSSSSFFAAAAAAANHYSLTHNMDTHQLPVGYHGSSINGNVVTAASPGHSPQLSPRDSDPHDGDDQNGKGENIIDNNNNNTATTNATATVAAPFSVFTLPTSGTNNSSTANNSSGSTMSSTKKASALSALVPLAAASPTRPVVAVGHKTEEQAAAPTSSYIFPSSTGPAGSSDTTTSFEAEDNSNNHQRLSIDAGRLSTLGDIKGSSRKLSPQGEGRKKISAMFDATLDFSDDFENSSNSESNSFSNSNSNSFSKSPINTSVSRGSMFKEEGVAAAQAAAAAAETEETPRMNGGLGLQEAQQVNLKEETNKSDNDDYEDDIEEDIEEDIVEDFEENEDEEDNDQYSFDEFDDDNSD